MDLSEQGQYNLRNLSEINILLGKNGAGKSTLLKKIEQDLIEKNIGEINYITPERGGTLLHSPAVEQNILNNPDWGIAVKRNNQWNQYKEYTVGQYRKLELLSLRELEKDNDLRVDLTYNFDQVIEKINKLLTNIKLVRSDKGDFEIFLIATDTKIKPGNISSGESELISLAIECLTFEKSCDAAKQNFLLMDEPDVHLHPDLQSNLIQFLLTLLASRKFKIIIATHSTAILGALLDCPDARFGILKNGESEVAFKPITEMYQGILPIFGAHPLSNLFNQSPILLVEGEDDVRIWQQAIRTSKGKLKLYPCSVDGIGNMEAYETSVNEIIAGVYDNAKSYSLRDRDEGAEDIDDLPPMMRFRLSCRAAENLILTDEVLAVCGTTWALLELEIEKWLVAFNTHQYYATMVEFKASGYDRKEFDLKNLRNILIGLTGTQKSWEIAVGQTIGKLINIELPKDTADNKVCNYLGAKLANHLLPIPDPAPVAG